MNSRECLYSKSSTATELSIYFQIEQETCKTIITITLHPHVMFLHLPDISKIQYSLGVKFFLIPLIFLIRIHAVTGYTSVLHFSFALRMWETSLKSLFQPFGIIHLIRKVLAKLP